MEANYIPLFVKVSVTVWTTFRSSKMLALYIFFPHHVTCVNFIAREQNIEINTCHERKYIKLAFYYYGS